MRKNILLVIVLLISSRLYAQEESLFVRFVGDTVQIWNTNVTANCAAQFISETVFHDNSIIITECDIKEEVVRCICSFDLHVSLTGLSAGQYTVAVYRQQLKKYYYPQDTTIFIGELIFNLENSSALTIASFFNQSDCLPEDNYQALQPFGLQDKVITALSVEQTDYNNFLKISDYLFAGTEEDGVFKVLTNEENPDWIPFGLKNKSITALTVQHWGTGPADGLRLYATVNPDFKQGDSTLIFSREVYLSMDTNWVEIDSGLDKAATSIYALNSYYFTGHTAPQLVLAGTNFGLYQKAWVDNFWTQSEIENENLYPVILSIDVNPHWGGNIAWAAGYFGLSPAAFRSTNQGNTWEVFPLTAAQDYIPASSVAVNTRNPDSIYVAWGFGIYCTPDNGETWEPIFSTRGGRIGTLAVDPQHPENIFAGAWFIDDSHQTPDHAVFLHSTNGGKDWNQIDPVTNVLLESITSIAVLNKLIDKSTYVFIGTKGNGVWRYKYSAITDVKVDKDIPEDFILYQNYPNPFNPTTNIGFRIVNSGFVSLKIYDVLGREAATLINEEKSPGEYQVEFHASGLSSGIYFYRLASGNFFDVRKFILMK